MRRTLYIILFVFVSGSLCRFGVPWWAIVPLAALAGGLFPLPAGRTFGAAFIGGFLLWMLNALPENNANDGMLSAKVGQLFLGVKGWHLLVVTGILGGILAGLGAVTGLLGRKLYVGSKPNP